jgi:hypothetical protein
VNDYIARHSLGDNSFIPRKFQGFPEIMEALISNRMQAALLRWALTKDLERVIYSRLSPRQPDFDLVRDLMLEAGTLDHPIEFPEYVDVRFAEGTVGETAWEFEAGGPGR